MTPCNQHTDRHLRTVFAAALLLFALASCHSEREVVYFQDRDSRGRIAVQPLKVIRVRPADKIAVIVKCEDPEASALFNQYTVNQILGSQQRVSVSGSNGIVGYTVDADGYIDMPVIGKLRVAGLTRFEISELVKNELARQGQALNASVSVEFVDLGVTVLGEVKNPGRKNIDRDSYTLLDAIAAAGDLTIDARRDITVTRVQGDSVRDYVIDLRKQTDVYRSPAYYLAQGDMIYVAPTAKKARTSTVNGNTILSASFWVSIASLLASLISIGLRYK